jgi:hypothetical protein
LNMRRHWIMLLALIMTLSLGTTVMATSHAGGQGAAKSEQAKSGDNKTKADEHKVKAEKGKAMRTKMGGLNALQKESVQLRKDLNKSVQELRKALVQAQKDGKNVVEIAKLVPGIKALKAPLSEALQAQSEDEAEDKKYKEAKKGKKIDAAEKAIEVRTTKLQAKIAALKKAIAAVKDLSAQLAVIN